VRFLVSLLVALTVCPAFSATVTTEEPGQIIFLSGVEQYTDIVAGAFGPAWQYTTQADAPDLTDLDLQPTSRRLTGAFPIGGTAGDVTFVEDVRRLDADTLQAQYGFIVNQQVTFSSLCISFFLPCDRYGGSTLVVRDSGGGTLQSLTLPEDFGETFLFWQSGGATVEVAQASHVGYAISFSPAAQLALQDNRAWGGTVFELRVELLGSLAGNPVPAGTQFSRPFTVDFPAQPDFQLDPFSAWSQNDTTGWIPYTMPWNAAPVDLSWLNDAPAGSHGFLRVADGHFAFEDGTPARFWGVCNSAAANFPTHEQSQQIAARMASFGLNMVRTHHADAGWSSPNFFDESFGDTQHFDADALDRFDYFVYCLKQHGIYVYLNQLVHRQFTAGDGVVNADQLDYAAKPYTLFDPALIALQQRFSHDLWNHVNPYTGLAYKDDPAIALMEFTNENDLQTADVTVEPYASNFEQRWRDWAAAHSVNPNQPVRHVSERSSDVLRFIDELQRSYYSQMYSYLRSIGVRVPITGNTWLVLPSNLPSQVTMDYMDGHSYWDHPYDNYSRWTNRMQVKVDPHSNGNNMSTLAVSRVKGMPFMASEWGHPWPNEWRAEGPLPMATVGAFQGWDGVLAYTYRHETTAPVDSIRGPFDTFNDPAVFGLMPASALLFRRGDVSSSALPTAVVWDEPRLFATPQQWLWGSTPAYRSLVEATPLLTALTTPTDVAQVVAPEDFPPASGPTWVASENGQLWRDWRSGIATVNSPRTQAVYGLVGSAGRLALSDASFSITTPFAAAALSSLDGLPLSESRRMLLTAVGRAENTHMRYNLTHTKLVSAGVGPILVEPVTGQLVLHTTGVRFCISAISPDGVERLLAIAEPDAGRSIAVELGPAAGAIYYKIVAAGRFRDVPIDHWAYHEIEACADAGIVAGYDDSTYRPDLTVTRDQMAVYVARALAGGEAEVPAGPAQPTFSDIPLGHWAYRHVEYSVARGVVLGYDDGTYRPYQAVDRGQMAVFMARAIAGGDEQVPAGPPEPTFPDAPADFWAYKYVEYVADPARAVTQGYPDGTYRPAHRCTRDQMAVYVARGFGLLP
jgi:hypothetical protein